MDYVWFMAGGKNFDGGRGLFLSEIIDIYEVLSLGHGDY